jgi:RNA polymerase sigma factor (sigma-70 family)
MAATGTRGARALDDLYRKHVGEVYRYAYAVLGNHADAEDVTQTAFVNAFRALERGERPRKPGNWLLAIAHNVIRQRWRQERARPPETELVDDVAGPQPDDESPVLADVVRALQRIPQGQREALVMRELEGRSYREIAEILGLSASALETLLFRARRSLSEELEQLVTCDRVELAVSQQLDGRLTRKERRRLDAHLSECQACARFAAGQRRHRKAIRSLAVLPIPVSLAFWKGSPVAAAAASLPSIGLGTGATSAGLATAGGGSTLGGIALGGSLAVKAAAVVAALGVTAGVSYEGVKRADPGRSATTPHTVQEAPKPVAGGSASAPASAAAEAHQRGASKKAGKDRRDGEPGRKTGRATAHGTDRPERVRAKPETPRSGRPQPARQVGKQKGTAQERGAPARATATQPPQANAKNEEKPSGAGQQPDDGAEQQGRKPKA